MSYPAAVSAPVLARWSHGCPEAVLPLAPGDVHGSWGSVTLTTLLGAAAGATGLSNLAVHISSPAGGDGESAPS